MTDKRIGKELQASLLRLPAEIFSAKINNDKVHRKGCHTIKWSEVIMSQIPAIRLAEFVTLSIQTI